MSFRVLQKKNVCHGKTSNHMFFDFKKSSRAYIDKIEFFFDVSEAVLARCTFPQTRVPL